MTTTFNATVSTATLSGANLVATSTGANQYARSADYFNSGAYYFEYTITTTGTFWTVGLATSDAVAYNTAIAAVVVYFNGTIYVNGVSTGSSIGSPTTGSVIGIAVSNDNQQFWARLNGGNWNGSGTANPTTGVGGIALPKKSFVSPWVSMSVSGIAITGNFGGSAFAFAAPAGFTSGWTSPGATTAMTSSQVGGEPWLSNSAPAYFSQIGAEPWYLATSAQTQARFSQTGIEAWYLVGTVAQFSQIGVEVWFGATYPVPPAKGAFNMPMLGM